MQVFSDATGSATFSQVLLTVPAYPDPQWYEIRCRAKRTAFGGGLTAEIRVNGATYQTNTPNGFFIGLSSSHSDLTQTDTLLVNPGDIISLLVNPVVGPTPWQVSVGLSRVSDEV